MTSTEKLRETTWERSPLKILAVGASFAISNFVSFLRYLFIFVRIQYHALRFPVPGTTWPLIGHLWVGLKYKMPDVLQYMIKVFRDCPLGVVWIGVIPVFYVCDPRDIERIAGNSKCSQKMTAYYLAEAGLNKGLVTTSGEKWRRHHKIIAPTFHAKVLESFVPVYNTKAEIFTRILRERMNDTDFDIMPMAERLTLDVIAETAMGVNLQVQTNSKSDVIDAIHTVEHLIMHRMLRPWLYLDCVFKRTEVCRKQREALETGQAVLRRIIEERQREMSMNNDPEHQSDKKRRLAFLDHLLLAAKEGQQISYEEIAQEVDTFTAAGFDTMSVLISYTFYELSRHLHVQEKIVSELESLFDPSLEAIEVSAEDLHRMPSLGAALKETLRLHPPVPFFGRTTQEDVRLASCDLVIPRGAQVVVSPVYAHTSPEYYSNPTVFDTDHFARENSAGRHPCAYIPFSYGQRSCIGKRMALMEAKAVMAKVLWNFRILPVPEHVPQDSWSVSVKPINGIRVRVEERRPTSDSKTAAGPVT